MTRIANSISKASLIGLLLGCIFGLMTLSANAADEFYTFKSVLSSGGANWCIEVPGSEYQAGKHVVISACSGKPNQVFGFERGGTLTIGGYCLDGLAATKQAPSAGDPVGLAECDGSDHQGWELPAFENRADVFAIANPDDLCVTVDGTIGQGTPLVMAQCAQLDTQGWLRSTTSTTSAEPEYYVYSGHRYCWYDEGWHNGGWYWCGENFHTGIGWGGPIGWHWWHHHGHPWHHHHPHHVPHHPHHVPHHVVHHVPHHVPHHAPHHAPHHVPHHGHPHPH